MKELIFKVRNSRFSERGSHKLKMKIVNTLYPVFSPSRYIKPKLRGIGPTRDKSRACRTFASGISGITMAGYFYKMLFIPLFPDEYRE